MIQQSILNCALPVWYPNFRQHTIETVFVKASDTFLRYLLSDEGLFLPESTTATTSLSDLTLDDDSLNSMPNNAAENGEKTKLLLQSRDFRDFHKRVDDAIHEIGGKVFPKLNWSSPRDAAWIALNNSLCCESFVDICLLMKSSDFIMHDLTAPFQTSADVSTNCRDSVQYALALRKWMDIAPSGEYRCFVKDNELFAVSQRHTQHFEFISASKESIVKRLKRFFKLHIKGKFPESRYTFDAYLGPSNGSSELLLDFNPFVEVTDSLLFTWSQLNGTEPFREETNDELVEGVAFRFVPPEGTALSHSNFYPMLS